MNFTRRNEMKENMQRVGAIVLRVVAVAAIALLVAGEASAQDKLKVASELQQAKLVTSAIPVYPVLDKRGRVEGTVRLTATIDKEGMVEKLETVSGHPILEQAAVEAVKKWRYRPTMLNGEPVEVITTIDVVFKLS